MTSEEMIKEVASLPTEARREIENLVMRLRKRYPEAKTPKPTAKNDLEAEAFIGMWSDRDDMADSTAWVRSVRKKHWAN